MGSGCMRQFKKCRQDIVPGQLQSRVHKVIDMHYSLEIVCIKYHYVCGFRYLSRTSAGTR